MKARIYLSAALVLFSVILLIVLGFVWAGANSSLGTTSVHEGAAAQTGPLVTPTSVADIERIPAYPGSTVQRNDADEAGISTLTLRTADDLAKIDAYYDKSLSQNGWRLIFSSKLVAGYDYWDHRTYLSSAQDGAPWDLAVELTLTQDPSGGMLINLVYERVPDIQMPLPVYPDAQQIVRSEAEGSYKGQGYYELEKDGQFVWVSEQPAHIITETYVTSASLADIERFYDSTMIDDGWEFWDRFGPNGNGQWGHVDKQTGSITSDEGLYFRGLPFDTTQSKYTEAHLFVTASPTGTDTNKVQLRAFVIQSTGIVFK